jgi:hypothetical protein
LFGKKILFWPLEYTYLIKRVLTEKLAYPSSKPFIAKEYERKTAIKIPPT